VQRKDLKMPFRGVYAVNDDSDYMSLYDTLLSQTSVRWSDVQGRYIPYGPEWTAQGIRQMLQRRVRPVTAVGF
jgi:hypothetical protein